jgi:hypothetical protein
MIPAFCMLQYPAVAYTPIPLLEIVTPGLVPRDLNKATTNNKRVV